MKTFRIYLFVIAFSWSLIPNGFSQETETSSKRTKVVEEKVYSFSPLGYIQSGNRRYNVLRHSDWLGLLNNEEFLKEIGVADKYRKEFRSRYLDLHRDWKSLDEESFAQVCEELEHDFLLSLKSHQKATCQRQLAIRELYKQGPIKYAKVSGVSELAIPKIRLRLKEVGPRLKNSLMALETETVAQIFDQVDPNEKEKLEFIYKTLSPLRSVCVTTIAMNLADIEDKDFETKAKQNIRIPRFGLDSVGGLTKLGDSAVNPFSDISVLISGQNWELKNDPSLKLFFETKFDQFLAIQKQRAIDEKQLRKELEGLPKRSVREAIQEFLEEYNLSVIDLANEIESELTVEEVKTLNQARFLAYFMREGPIESLTTRNLTQSIDLRFTRSDFERIKKASQRILKQHQKVSKSIHDDFVETVFKGIVDRNDQPLEELKWDLKAGTPPLEILLSFGFG